MAVDVIMPQMGESIFEGTITKWLKKPGDRIERDEPLFEISTDKVDAEIPAPSAGVLKEIKVPEGKTVPIQTVVAVIEAAGASAAAPAAAPAPPPAPAAAPPKTEAPKAAAPALPRTCSACQRLPSAHSDRCPGWARQRPGSSQLSAGPPHGERTQRGSREVEGSGAGGRVSKKDILAALESGSAKAAAPAVQPAAATSVTAPRRRSRSSTGPRRQRRSPGA